METINNQSDDRVFAMQQVIRKLRHDDLNEGHCFMIFDDDLPDDQAYYEYPDGLIKVEQLNKENLEAPRLVIRELTDKEIAEVKNRSMKFSGKPRLKYQLHHTYSLSTKKYFYPSCIV